MELEKYNNNNLLKNKDLLIVSLLDHICQTNDTPELYDIIINFLKQNGIHLPNIIDENFITEFINEYNTFKVGNYKQLTFNFTEDHYKNNFIQIEQIGKGGFGSVYKCFNKVDQSLYAVKKIELSDFENFLPLNEVKNLAKLNHLNIIRYYNSWLEFSTKPLLYIQMELVQDSLRNVINERNYNQKEIDINLENNRLLQIIDGLQYIHSKGIIHCDLNPSNILVDTSLLLVDTSLLKICDFGLSISNNEFGGSSYGNELYRAPNKEKITFETDVYSLGIIYYELLNIFTTQFERIEKITLLRNKVECECKLIERMLSTDSRIKLSEIKKSIF